MDIKVKIGNRIRELRLEKNLSQTDLAIDAEINRGYLSAVEKGSRNIAIENLEKIIGALDTDFENFFKHESFH